MGSVMKERRIRIKIRTSTGCGGEIKETLESG